MIPHKIHYCWFGHNPKPPLAIRCIESWKKYCPDYEIIEWNEENYDLSKAPAYTQQAYEMKKYGFVPDYIRLWLIYTYGGIYLDVDVELVKPLDELCELSGFAGFEEPKYVALGLGFGAEAGSSLIKELMETYETMSFINEDGSLNLTPSPKLNMALLVEKGLRPDGTWQQLEGFTFLPAEYLCPWDSYVDKPKLTSNSYSYHHYMASWFSHRRQVIKSLKLFIRRHIPVISTTHSNTKKLVRKVLGETRYKKLHYIKEKMLD